MMSKRWKNGYPWCPHSSEKEKYPWINEISVFCLRAGKFLKESIKLVTEPHSISVY